MLKKLIVLHALLIVSAYGQSHLEMIAGPFNTAQEVTAACLNCHESAAREVMQTTHWTWLGPGSTDAAHQSVATGKINIVNNFCLAVPSNYPRCTSCHTGYGWKDATFDFGEEENVDCLVCHDQSGQYKKSPAGAGMPDKSVDLLAAAQSVSKSTRKNCGICHFDGGGGTGVKHGDMDDSLYEPSRETDVHMGGLGFTCTDCHKTGQHKIAGASHASMAAGQNHIQCSDCHSGKIHKITPLDRHTRVVACETCHIPAFARVKPTKLWWDWSKAGDSRPESRDEFGMEAYNKTKGEFLWGMNVIPTYRWYNGQASYYRFGEKIDPAKPVALNRLHGSRRDTNARIAPFKIMRGKQIYDAAMGHLIVPKLFGEGGYWKSYDWDQAARLGMQEIQLDYSGQYGFVETEMYWPINHMVAPKEEALKCGACHGKEGRMDWKALGYAGDPLHEKRPAR
jgi:octaheme c-type cytochrome (tetrathionate reductase family)